MIYELKMYRAHPGKRAQVVQRFRDHAAPVIGRLGGNVLDGWVAQNDPDRFFYIVGFADDAARQQIWSAFAQDPTWKTAKADSEKDGPLIAEQTTELLLPALLQQPGAD